LRKDKGMLKMRKKIQQEFNIFLLNMINLMEEIEIGVDLPKVLNHLIK